MQYLLNKNCYSLIGKFSPGNSFSLVTKETCSQSSIILTEYYTLSINYFFLTKLFQFLPIALFTWFKWEQYLFKSIICFSRLLSNATLYMAPPALNKDQPLIQIMVPYFTHPMISWVFTFLYYSIIIEYEILGLFLFFLSKGTLYMIWLHIVDLNSAIFFFCHNIPPVSSHWFFYFSSSNSVRRCKISFHK